ncbi:MAG: VCBS repeat-containing protein, partial [Bacteroidota bacterium]|nr:VCBS repeat-containing protein [Bacteroidota bacterium]
ENSTILYQQNDQSFKKQELPETELFEDGQAVIFDANNDGKLDLYVTSGGTERYAGHEAYQDRLYFNTATGFVAQPLPEMLTSTFAVTAADFDNDGFVDLFVGGRVVPGKFPMAPQSYILKNNGGNFVDVTAEVCPFLQNAGMVTAATFKDYNKNGKVDLILAGEFMPITILENEGGTFKNKTEALGLSKTTGLWNSITAADFDNDGDIDFAAGNIGLNTVLNSGQNQALKVDFADFDNNGYVDPIFSKYEEGAYFPIATLDQLTQQLPQLKKKFLYYHRFAKANTSELLQLLKTPYQTLKAEELRSILIENTESGFIIKPLPIASQLAPVNAMLCEDIDQDGYLDLLLVGNDYSAEVNGGRYDASFGTTLLNTQDGGFKEFPRKHSGFTLKGDSKSIVK